VRAPTSRIATARIELDSIPGDRPPVRARRGRRRPDGYRRWTRKPSAIAVPLPRHGLASRNAARARTESTPIYLLSTADGLSWTRSTGRNFAGGPPRPGGATRGRDEIGSGGKSFLTGAGKNLACAPRAPLRASRGRGRAWRREGPHAAVPSRARTCTARGRRCPRPRPGTAARVPGSRPWNLSE